MTPRFFTRTLACFGTAAVAFSASAVTGYTILAVGPANSRSNDITNSGYVFVDAFSWDDKWIGAYYGNGVGSYNPAPGDAVGVRDAADGSIWAVGDRMWSYWNSARGRLDIPGPAEMARDIDRVGRVVGYASNNAAFVYADFGNGWETKVLPHFNYRPAPGQRLSYGATAISNSGYVVGGVADTDGVSHGFFYNIHNDEFRDVGLSLTGVDVNDDGKALFTNDGLPASGYIYDAKTDRLTEMGSFGSYIPNAINRWGQVVGTRYVLGVPEPFTPFIWENGKFTSLKPLLAAQGFVGYNATGINDRGQIAAWGYYSVGGPPQAILLTPTTGTSPFFPEAKPVDSTATAAFIKAATGNWFASQNSVPAPAPTDAAAPLPGPQTPQAYRYVATDATRFAQVMNFPNGFGGPVVVSVDGVVLGAFSPGQPVRFSDFAAQLGTLLDGGGVRAFDVTGIRPLDDFDAQPEFSLQLAFARATGDFKIQGRNDLVGDANGDHLVDFSDFTRLAAAYGHSARSWFDGDFNLDGTVGPTDFQLFLDNINRPLSPDQQRAIDTFVPEPAGLGLMGLALMLGRRNRRR